MRIDLVITELFVGGAERCLTELATALQDRGHQVRVASIAPLPRGPQGQLVTRLLDRRIEVFSCDSRHRLQLPKAWRRLSRWLRQGRPDVIQSMLFHANVLAAIASTASPDSRLVGGLRVAEPIRWRLTVERRALRRMETVVCVSRAVQRFAQRMFPDAAAKTVVIPNAIDVNRVDACEPIDWTSLGWPPQANVLLYVGRLHHQKGLDLLVDALPGLLGRFPEMHCCLVGQGPQHALLQQAQQRLGSDRFRLLGWRHDALSLIKACRLLVLPSRYEGMPNVVLEAMAAGKPVACTRVEGIDELLGDQFDQQTCPAGDAAALQQLLENLWVSPQISESIGRANRRLAEQNHSIEVSASAYELIYRGGH